MKPYFLRLLFVKPRKVRLWDIASGSKISEMAVHNDYCRAGATAHNDPNVFLSGGYDNTVNLLDLRSQEVF